jgi:hypothetical protein
VQGIKKWEDCGDKMFKKEINDKKESAGSPSR